MLDLGLDALHLALDALRLLLGIRRCARVLARHAARLGLDSVDRAVDVVAAVVVAAAASRRNAGDRQSAGYRTGCDPPPDRAGLLRHTLSPSPGSAPVDSVLAAL